MIHGRREKRQVASSNICTVLALRPWWPIPTFWRRLISPRTESHMAKKTQANKSITVKDGDAQQSQSKCPSRTRHNLLLKEELAKLSGITQQTAKAFLDAIPVAVATQLQKNGRSLIPGFVYILTKKVRATTSKTKTTVDGVYGCIATCENLQQLKRI